MKPERLRTIRLWALLSVLSLLDVVLTVWALKVVPGAREVNRVPAVVLAYSAEAFVGLKVFSVFVVLALALIVESSHPRAIHRVLGAACAVLATVDAFSFFQLHKAGVF